MPGSARRARRAAVCLAACGSGLAGACIDPSIEAVVDRLGPEQPGVEQGPEHRPGQPCVTCHHGSGPGSPELSLGGTIYQDQRQALPLAGASVEFEDARGVGYSVLTNCVGNFYVRQSDWQPRFPLWVRVSFGDEAIAMKTPIYRDGSCASCHADPAASDSTGHVYASEEPFEPPVGGCQ